MLSTPNKMVTILKNAEGRLTSRPEIKLLCIVAGKQNTCFTNKSQQKWKKRKKSISIKFYLYGAFNNGHYHRATLQISGYRNRLI